MNRIVLDCEPTKNQVSGLYQFCLQLGKVLIQQIDPEKEELNFFVPGMRKGFLGNNQFYLQQRAFHKLWIPGSGKFNVWHSSIQNSPYMPASGKVKMVLTIHDLNFLIQRKKEPYKIKKYLRQVQQNINRADHIVCISDFTLQSVKDHLQLHGKPVTRIYNGCNINDFPSFDKPVYLPEKPYIFGLGALVPKKNFHVLPCLLKNNDFELVIAGTVHQTYADTIMQEAVRYGVEKRIRLLGEISEEDKSWYYQHCLAFAFPSLAEGFGFPLIEAMYYGKPCFIAANTSLPEIGAGLAYLFESFDPTAMQQVFESGMLHFEQHKMANQIRKHALQFNWTQTGRAYLSIYRSLYL